MRPPGSWTTATPTARLSETCGNGLRVFARYLVETGLAEPGELSIATRGGVVTVWLEAAGDVTVDMGAPQISATATATVDGQVFEGVAVSMGNPHLVCVTDVEVASLDLTTMPDVDGPAFPDGVNVEFVNIVGERHAQMRVYERGSGETQSCGSGACAVVAAMAALDGDRGGEYIVDVPGGRLCLRFNDAGHLLLRGPAVLVADGTFRVDQTDARGAHPDHCRRSRLWPPVLRLGCTSPTHRASGSTPSPSATTSVATSAARPRRLGHHLSRDLDRVGDASAAASSAASAWSRRI